MPQMMFEPFMRRTMVEDAHGVKPSSFARETAGGVFGRNVPRGCPHAAGGFIESATQSPPIALRIVEVNAPLTPPSHS
jgi:hypothetical protein